jgi:hypothetical protein
MIGGETAVVKHLDPIFAHLAPGAGDIARTPGRETTGGTAERGYLHCGPNGAGHFVKGVHNGIESGSWPPTPKGSAFSEPRTLASGATRSTPKRRRCATPSTISTTSICPTSPRCGAVAASSPPGSSTCRLPLSSRTLSSRRFRAACPIPARALDDQGGHR